MIWVFGGKFRHPVYDSGTVTLAATHAFSFCKEFDPDGQGRGDVGRGTGPVMVNFLINRASLVCTYKEISL